MNTYVYSIEDNPQNAETLYINLTNKCSNACVFCIRTTVDDIKGKNMWLENEDFSAEDVLKQFENFNTPKEVVFCGYGEPLMKFEILKEVAENLKQKGIKIRINTNGTGNIINKKDIVPELAKFTDEISISLNAPEENQYNEISKPKLRNTYSNLLDFAKKSVENNIKTTLTVVDEYPSYKLDIQACKKIADEIGADFRVRKWISNGY